MCDNQIQLSIKLLFVLLLLPIYLCLSDAAHGADQLSQLREQVRSPAQTSRSTAASQSSDSRQTNSRQPSRTNSNQESPANGVLSQIRTAVRSKPTPNRNPTSRPGSANRHRENRPVRHRRAPQTRHYNCSPAPVWQPVWGPSVIVHEQIIEPVYVPVTPPPTVVVQETPAYQPPPEQLFEPFVDCPAPLTARVIDSIGSDWFQDCDSRLTAYGGLDFDDLSTAGLQLLVQGDLIGLDTSVSTWRESGTNIRDHLWLGDANLVFQVIDRPRLKTRLGLGVNWLGDRWGGEAGFNLTASMDVKLNSRWTLTGEGDIGTLGDADLLHTKIAINRRLLNSQAEWTTGYERYDIDGVELQAVYTGLQFRY